MTTRRNTADDPSIPQISARDILLAWGLLGLIAGYVLVTEPSCPRGPAAPASIPVSADQAAGARPAPGALDGFENAEDRAAALAGLEDDPNADITQHPRPVARLPSEPLQTCHVPARTPHDPSRRG